MREPSADWTDEYFWMFGREPQTSTLDSDAAPGEGYGDPPHGYTDWDEYDREMADLRCL